MDFQQMLPMVSMSKVNVERSSSEPRNESADALHRACQDFESVFVAYLLKTMRRTVPKTELMNGGMGEDIYLSMMNDEIARAVAKGPGIGLAAAIYRQLSQAKNI